MTVLVSQGSRDHLVYLLWPLQGGGSSLPFLKYCLDSEVVVVAAVAKLARALFHLFAQRPIFLPC